MQSLHSVSCATHSLISHTVSCCYSPTSNSSNLQLQLQLLCHAYDGEARRKMTRNIGQPELLSASLEPEIPAGIHEYYPSPIVVQTLASYKSCIVEVIFMKCEFII